MTPTDFLKKWEFTTDDFLNVCAAIYYHGLKGDTPKEHTNKLLDEIVTIANARLAKIFEGAKVVYSHKTNGTYGELWGTTIEPEDKERGLVVAIEPIKTECTEHEPGVQQMAWNAVYGHFGRSICKHCKKQIIRKWEACE